MLIILVASSQGVSGRTFCRKVPLTPYFQFKGEFYIYGSQEEDRRQIAKVTDCSLKRVGSLPFDHKFGSCAANGNELFLCFDLNTDGKTCNNANEATGPFNEIAKSAEMHFWTRSAANEGFYPVF